ncbi:MAG: RNA 2',3'-cyclic phosphodiesterase [Thermomicrobium sp.]|nr:RNA 2',3'-cyclic phosphodiesterase [Thermomicrobium sp.]
MREQWRLFAAISLPETVRERIAAAIAHLQARGYRAKWVDPAGSHLTVRFFGSVGVEQVPELVAALRASVDGVAPFVLRVEGAGAFPHPERPRVLWLGVDGPVHELRRLVERVELHAGTFAEARDDRPYHPHITLARLRPEDAWSLRGLPRELERLGRLPPVEFAADRLTLYRSELFRTGPRYTVVEEFPLG